MNREDEIFAEAIELPLGERAAFLDRACGGDAGLRARVTALIEGHDAASDFLDKPLFVRPLPPPGEQPGDVIGRYTLVRKVGEGGCGVVYLAEQHQPVKRFVALKVIKLGMDTREVIARFEAERQALALMDHPDIARVFDAGATDEGRPFFVMEFVDGVPITKFCDEHSLSMEARLELFARVCLALQHAHQKGIIHRDLKPSNILVSLHDGAPAPKVIDFGIAKATQGRLTDHTVFTGLDQFIGTPAYMSPEQAELRELDIDTRSDVYSLGVLLYELLTGRPPYDPKSLVRAGVEEIRRIIREVDPPRPSTCVETLAAADRATVARQRQAAPVRLSSALRGDLDWIVMRCLEKDRERRYGTAHELADDVRRHLRDEPVVARPPSATYRAQKFVARNRLACASAAAIALALIAGTIVSVRQAIRARRAEEVANAQRDTAEAARAAEALARTDAQRRQDQAEALLAFMLGDFQAELKKAGKLTLLDAVGDKAMEYFATLNARDQTDTALNRQARALTQIGETRIAQARDPEASAAFSTAFNRTAELVKRHPQDSDMLFERAQAEYWIGYVARRSGDPDTCRQWFTRYRDSAVALVALEGKKPRAQRELTASQHNLAVLEYDSGHFAAARAGFVAEIAAVQQEIAARPDDPNLRSRLPEISSWLALVAEREGKMTEAIDHGLEMSSRLEELIKGEPTLPRLRYRLGESISSLGGLLMLTGRLAEAAEAFDRAGTLYNAVVTLDPKNQQWRTALLQLQIQRSLLLLGQGETTLAAPLIGLARTGYAELIAADPTPNRYLGRLAQCWQIEGRLRFMLDRPDAAEAVNRALEIGGALVKDAKADARIIGEYAQAEVLAGRIEAKAGRDSEARRHWSAAIDVLASRLPESNDWRLLDPASQAYLLTGQPDKARPLIERLKRSGYRPIDPLAASLLDAAP